MKKTILHLQESPGELFEYARWNDYDKSQFSNIKMYFNKTKDGESFYGRQDDVYDKFVKHKVNEEASLVGSVVDRLKTIDFEESKWQFAQRLTEGDSVDVGRYLDGQERCWCGVRRTVRPKKCVRIYASQGGHCGRSKEELAVGGAVATTLCEILESTGVGVEIWTWAYSVGCAANGTDFLHLVRIKSADEFADLGMINYITGDNHVFRNTCFRNWCRKMDEAGMEADGGLGCHGDVTKEMLEGYDDGTSDGIILIPSLYDVDEAKKWLIVTINNFQK